MKKHFYRKAIGYFFESIKFDATWLARFLWLKVVSIVAWPLRVGRRVYKKWLMSG